MRNILAILADADQVLIDAVNKVPGKDSWSSITTGNFVGTILNWVYALMGLIAAGFIVYGAIQYQLAQGDAGKVKMATTTIISAVIGLGIVLLAAAITNFVVSVTARTPDMSMINMIGILG